MVYRPKTPVSALVRANEAKPCSVPGCSGHRHALSQYCLRHYSTYERHGHPLASPTRPSHYKAYKAKLQELVEANEAHPGLTRASHWIQQWMASAGPLERQEPWAMEVMRLIGNGVTPIQVLVELASCWSYIQDHPGAYRDQTHRDFTLSKAVLGLTPRPRRFTAADNLKGGKGYAMRPKPAALRYIGKHLRESLAPLLVTLHQAIKADEQVAAKAVEDYRSPLLPSHSSVTQAAKKLPHP